MLKWPTMHKRDPCRYLDLAVSYFYDSSWPALQYRNPSRPVCLNAQLPERSFQHRFDGTPTCLLQSAWKRHSRCPAGLDYPLKPLHRLEGPADIHYVVVCNLCQPSMLMWCNCHEAVDHKKTHSSHLIHEYEVKFALNPAGVEKWGMLINNL